MLVGAMNADFPHQPMFLLKLIAESPDKDPMFHHYSGRSAPIFKQASGAPRPGESFGLPLKSEQTPGQAPEPSSENQGAGLPGQYLNTLDVELTAGLESYMPTPMFRLRVARGRLRGEIGELREQLAHYDRLPDKTPDMTKRVER